MMAEIIYNGQSTKEFGLRVLNDITHESSAYDIELLPVPGRDGVLLMDNQRLKPVERAFPLRLEKDVYDSTSRITEWLGVKGWHDLELSWDQGYVYQATNINKIAISEVLKQLGKLQVVFLVHPVKYFKKNPEITVTNGGVVFNQGNVRAMPTIELIGNGNTTITINNRIISLENIQGSIILDMKKRMVYSGNLSSWDKVIREENTQFPYLDIGENKISWTGSFVMKMEMNAGVRI